MLDHTTRVLGSSRLTRKAKTRLEACLPWISEAVAKLWRGGPSEAGRAKVAALAFFPRSVSDVQEGSFASAAEAPPPPAPAPSASDANTPAQPRRQPRLKSSVPLDLSAFMKWRRT